MENSYDKAYTRFMDASLELAKEFCNREHLTENELEFLQAFGSHMDEIDFLIVEED